MARKTLRHQLDSPTKNQIIGALACGVTVAQASRLYNVPDSTIRSLRKKFNTTGTMHNLPRSGRPRKLSPRARRRMLYFALKHDRIAWKHIGEMWSPKVCRTTALRVLKEQEARRCRMRKVPYISRANRRIRREFASRFRGWTDGEWANVIFSDESYVYIGGSPGCFYITRRTNNAYEDGKTIPRFSQSTIKVMIWACIAYGKKGPIVVLDYPGGKGGGMNSQRYITQVLDGPLSSFYDSLASEGRVPVFQQDNAKAHVAKTSILWFKSAGITLFPHPASSPDLNPIESIWSMLKDIIRRRPRMPTSILELKQAILDAWEEITVEDINACIRSMPNRLKAVSKAFGGPTKY